MTSHRGEGWGMVVNEALSCGCCVIANRELGAAPWLVEHGKNLRVFIADLCQVIIMRKRFSESAGFYTTMNSWMNYLMKSSQQAVTGCWIWGGWANSGWWMNGLPGWRATPSPPTASADA